MVVGVYFTPSVLPVPNTTFSEHAPKNDCVPQSRVGVPVPALFVHLVLLESSMLPFVIMLAASCVESTEIEAAEFAFATTNRLAASNATPACTVNVLVVEVV